MSLTFFIKQIKDSIYSLSKFSYVLVASFVDFNIFVVCCDGMSYGFQVIVVVVVVFFLFFFFLFFVKYH